MLKIKGLLSELNGTMERIQGGPARDPTSDVAARAVGSFTDMDNTEDGQPENLINDR